MDPNHSSLEPALHNPRTHFLTTVCFACFHRFPSCSRKRDLGGLPKTRRARGVKIPVHYIAFLALFFSGALGTFCNGLYSMHRAQNNFPFEYRVPGRISVGLATRVFDLRSIRTTKPPPKEVNLWKWIGGVLKMHEQLCERWSEVWDLWPSSYKPGGGADTLQELCFPSLIQHLGGTSGTGSEPLQNTTHRSSGQVRSGQVRSAVRWLTH
jgi:hypothetical protein